MPCSQGVISSACRSAKAEVRGANPRESAISIYDFRSTIYEAIAKQRLAPIPFTPRKSSFVNRQFPVPLCLSSYRASFVNSYSSVRVRPGAPSFALTRRNRVRVKDALHSVCAKEGHCYSGSELWMAGHSNGDHDVTCSITPREGVCAGANPVGHPTFDGPKLIGYPPPIRRAYRPWRKPWRSGFDSRHGVPPCDHATCPSDSAARPRVVAANKPRPCGGICCFTDIPVVQLR